LTFISKEEERKPTQKKKTHYNMSSRPNSNGGRRSRTSSAAGRSIVQTSASKHQLAKENAAVARQRNMRQASMSGGRGGYWDIYKTTAEPEKYRSGSKPTDKYSVSPSGQKKGPYRMTRPRQQKEEMPKDAFIFDPITGDIMMATNGHPGIPSNHPSFLDKKGMTNNSKITVDPITGEVMMEKQQYLKFYQPGTGEEAKVNVAVSKKGYGQAYVGDDEAGARSQRNYELFLKDGGRLRADVNTAKITGRRDENIITWRDQTASRLTTPAELGGESEAEAAQNIGKIIRMDGVSQTRGAFNGVRTKVGGWPDMQEQGNSALLANAKAEMEYEPPVNGAITTRTETSDAQIREFKEGRRVRDEKILGNKPNMRANDLNFQVPEVLR